MRSLIKMHIELPDVYKAYTKFVNDNVFGDGEEEAVHPNDEEQRGFMTRFDAEFAAAKVKEKERQQKGKNRTERENTADFADGPASGSGGNQN